MIYQALLSLVSSAIILGSAPAQALDNGLALTPQRGWNTWNKYGCNINASIILANGKALIDEGLHKAGYEYVVVDDCWQGPRDPSTGRITVDSTKFPHGLKNLTDEIHAMGLKAGIYSSAGSMTCGRHVGSLDHEEIDAQTFADWGFDYLKYDNCFNEGRSGTPKISYDRYNAMTMALNKTGRPILFSLCQWGEDSSYLWAPTIANSWRISGDIYDNFDRADARCPCDDMTTQTCYLQGFHCSVKKIVNFAKSLGQKAFPSAWLDLDMLEVGNGGMSTTEYVTHFSMWAMMRSAMILGNELFSMDNATRAIVKNTHVLDLISGDANGSPAYPVWEETTSTNGTEMQLWFSSLVNGTYAAALVNWGSQDASGQSIDLSTFFVDDAPARKASWDVYDLWAGVDFKQGTVPAKLSKLSGSPFTGSIGNLDVPSHGIKLLRLVPAGTDGKGMSEQEHKRRALQEAEHVQLERAMQWQEDRVNARRMASRGL
ncbi:glycoside hydrolase family 27 protein [Tilletiaria anomala UBC 951]|uniref:Alpha-galactosidase n=1 Tax=Tilletiaria anomala (strain ATCC 24038 / CBS 436.72 / UBC 951) TaxID=1037660 RepID=A0A066WEB0_TILAU|nr:glycoside hydrolase family 27 protein [Tilletiaria anomala UBC 951]KDN50838.1 glycoside hydrolase family 27 protein [Tilletiaria anomala UBC 951]